MNPDDEEKVTYLGETDARNRRLRFGIKRKDRAKHLYAIGKTGMGKSTLLENLAVQDIINGEGVCFLDPHGKSADLLMEYIPEHRIKDVIYFAPFDMDYPVSFNVMEDVGPEQRYLVASGMMSAFKKIWVDAWSARMEYILGNIMLALLEYPGSTLVGVNRMLTDKDFRKEVVNHISDPSVKSFWVNEYANYTEKFAAEAAPAIQNKVGQFVANPLIRNIIGQPKSSFDIRDVMDNKKILLINLSKGRVGEANANLLGSMLITKIYLGAMSRADLSERELEKAPNFYLYVDEFQSFANESFADILSEARKYKLNLHIAHQYIEQMTDEVRAAVFGNVGTMCVFRVGSYDAEVIEKEFAPYFTAEDIVNLQKYQMYLKLMIDGVASQPFSASGLNPPPRPEISYTKEILASSRELYARPRQQVEEELLEWIQKKFGGGGGSTGSSGGKEGGGGSSREGGGSNREGGSGSRGGRDGGSSYSGGGNSGGGSGGGYKGESRGGGSSSGSGAGGGRSSSGGYTGGSSSYGESRSSGGSSSGSGVGSGSRFGDSRSEGGRSRDTRESGPRQDQGQAGRSTGGSRAEVSRAPQAAPQTQAPYAAPAPISAGTPSAPSSQTSDRTDSVSSSGSFSSAPRNSATAAPVPSNPVPAPVSLSRLSQSPATSQDSRPQSPARQSNYANTHTQASAPRDDKREQDLRKAMSLSYLKPEAPVQRDKTPKPENVAALRDALLSVMKSGGMLPNDSGNNSSENSEDEGNSNMESEAAPRRQNYVRQDQGQNQNRDQNQERNQDQDRQQQSSEETPRTHAHVTHEREHPKSHHANLQTNSHASEHSSSATSSYAGEAKVEPKGESKPEKKEVDQSELSNIFAD